MKRLAAALSIAALGAAPFAAQGKATKSLEIYVIDAEGGKAVLYISPTGQTLLVDAGNPGGRDTDRLMAAIADAGVTKIDYLISSHYHTLTAIDRVAHRRGRVIATRLIVPEVLARPGVERDDVASGNS